MKRYLKIGLSVLGILCLAAVAYAGGSMCSGSADGANATSAMPHCEGMKAEHAGSDQCTLGPNQAVYSFAVPGAECEACQNIIQRTAMSQKGVVCAHVDLATRTAYIVADKKKMNQKSMTKAISKEGYKCEYKASGQQVQAEFVKMMTAGTGGACCAKNKDKA